MVLYGRGTRLGLQAYASCGEGRHRLEDLQIHSQEADVVDLRFLLYVSCRQNVNYLRRTKLTISELPRTSTLLDRLHGSVATIHRLLNRADQHPADFHRSPPRSFLLARHNISRMPQPPWSMDLPSILRILCRHRLIHLERARHPQIHRVLLRRFQRHGIPDSVQLGKPHDG